MEACTSSHHWGRAIGDPGNDVRLIPPADVKPFVKRQSEAVKKTIRGIVFPPNDMADAEATGVGRLPATLLYSRLGQDATGSLRAVFRSFSIPAAPSVFCGALASAFRKKVDAGFETVLE